MKRTLTITATGKEAEKSLLNINRKSLRFLHNTDGFDFEKEHFIAEVSGSITANAVISLLSEHFKCAEYKAVIMLYVTNARCTYDNGLRHGHIIDGKFDIDKSESTYNYGICSEYRKLDFESFRKSCDRAFIIAQKESLIKHLVYKPYDYSERISVNAGNKHDVDYRADKKAFDKSGYYTKFIKEHYAQRVKALKAERAKNAADTYDCTADTERIRAEIKELSETVSQLFVMPTVERMNRAEKATSKLYWLIRDFTDYENALKAKTFSSIDGIKDTIERMEKSVSSINSILNVE